MKCLTYSSDCWLVDYQLLIKSPILMAKIGIFIKTWPHQLWSESKLRTIQILLYLSCYCDCLAITTFRGRKNVYNGKMTLWLKLLQILMKCLTYSRDCWLVDYQSLIKSPISMAKIGSLIKTWPHQLWSESKLRTIQILLYLSCYCDCVVITAFRGRKNVYKSNVRQNFFI